MTTLELLTPAEQKAILVVAEYLMSQRTGGQKSGVEALLEELHLVEPRFTAPDEGLSLTRAIGRAAIHAGESGADAVAGALSWSYLTLDDVLGIHEDSIAAFAGSHGLPDRGLTGRGAVQRDAPSGYCASLSSRGAFISAGMRRSSRWKN